MGRRLVKPLDHRGDGRRRFAAASPINDLLDLKLNPCDLCIDTSEAADQARGTILRGRASRFRLR
jgi:hypothetical protein